MTLTPSYKIDFSDGRKAVVVGWDDIGGPRGKFAVDCEDSRFEPPGGFFGDFPEVRPVNGRVTLDGKLVEA